MTKVEMGDTFEDFAKRRRAERAGPPGSGHVNSRNTITADDIEDTMRWLNGDGEPSHKRPRRITCNQCSHYPIDHHNSVGGAWCSICQERCGTLRVPFTDMIIRFGHTWRRDGTCPCGVSKDAARADTVFGI